MVAWASSESAGIRTSLKTRSARSMLSLKLRDRLWEGKTPIEEVRTDELQHTSLADAIGWSVNLAS